MLSELASARRVAGIKQSRKAIREGRAKRVFLACDADEAIIKPLAAACADAGIPVEARCTMAQIGTACHVAVGASVAVILR